VVEMVEFQHIQPRGGSLFSQSILRQGAWKLAERGFILGRGMLDSLQIQIAEDVFFICLLELLTLGLVFLLDLFMRNETEAFVRMDQRPLLALIQSDMSVQ
jgi:hypothetical protein